MKQSLEEHQIVLCTVDKIIGTTVFVKLDDYNLEGTISFPEIAPGRIRNIRDFAFPGKKIVCKVLYIKQNSVELSLRRVKVNERNDFNERYKREKSYAALLKTILADKAQEIIQKIKQNENSLYELIENSKENPNLLEKYLAKEHAKKIISILKEKKVKEKLVSVKFSLSSKASDGILKIKNIIKESTKDILKENFEVSYIAAGKYFIKMKSKDPKHADQQLRKIMQSIENLSKKQDCDFKEEK
jgi:translation initiation factor 2 alpha subunit (eIF-2alpha)